MKAADVADTAVASLADEAAVDAPADEMLVDPWPGCELPVCDLRPYDPQPYELVDPTPQVDPVLIDDSCLLVDDSTLIAVDPQIDQIDIRVQFISSDSTPGWAAYFYTIGVDGTVQGVSVIASYEEPTIAAFVAAHADDPTIQIADCGDSWWIDSYPQDLAPPAPEPDVFTDEVFTIVDEPCSDEDASDGLVDASGSVDIGVDFTVVPLIYARDSEATNALGDGFAAYCMQADIGMTGDAGQVDSEVAEPVVVDTRSAAFADMSVVAAATTSQPAPSSDAVIVGGGRRRR